MKSVSICRNHKLLLMIKDDDQEFGRDKQII